MNQILYTGEERNRVELEKRQKQWQEHKQKKTLPIKNIIVFYAVSIIILGICMISGSVYAKTRINETVEANKEPEIALIKNEKDNELEIQVTHIRGIKNITYSWNDEEEVTIDCENQKAISKVIELMGGENILNISVREENDKVTSQKSTITAPKKAEIDLKAVDNGIEVKVTAEEEIDYIQYSWDDGEKKKIEVGEKEYKGTINAPKGKHILDIEVVDIKGGKVTRREEIIGDTEPTLKIQSKLINGKIKFVIDAEDDESIKTVSIIHNRGEEQIIDVNEKTFHKEIIMTEGEENTIIVKVTNINDLIQRAGAKFTNI